MEDRLGRVEQKIDDLQAAIVLLARVEERLVTVFNRQSSIETKINSMDERLTEMVAKTNNRFAERIFWIVVIAITTSITNYLG